MKKTLTLNKSTVRRIQQADAKVLRQMQGGAAPAPQPAATILFTTWAEPRK